MAVFLAKMVMPRSRSRSLESITRSMRCSLARNVPLWRSMASTSVVLPWSTWAMIAILRMLEVKLSTVLFFSLTTLLCMEDFLESVRHFLSSSESAVEGSDSNSAEMNVERGFVRRFRAHRGTTGGFLEGALPMFDVYGVLRLRCRSLRKRQLCAG